MFIYNYVCIDYIGSHGLTECLCEFNMLCIHGGDIPNMIEVTRVSFYVEILRYDYVE